jgi:hypothetical protein
VHRPNAESKRLRTRVSDPHGLPRGLKPGFLFSGSDLHEWNSCPSRSFAAWGLWSGQAKAKPKQWWKCLFRLHVLPAVTGSFDCA